MEEGVVVESGFGEEYVEEVLYYLPEAVLECVFYF